MSSYDETDPNKPTIIKDPNSVLDYSIDLTDWLAQVSDTIATIDVSGSGVTVESSSTAGSLIVAWISGGTIGQTASVTFRFTTTSGRTDERTIYLKIRER